MGCKKHAIGGDSNFVRRRASDRTRYAAEHRIDSRSKKDQSGDRQNGNKRNYEPIFNEPLSAFAD
jgi:hypothetical protein